MLFYKIRHRRVMFWFSGTVLQKQGCSRKSALNSIAIKLQGLLIKRSASEL
jgi:hypothetical protein